MRNKAFIVIFFSVFFLHAENSVNLLSHLSGSEITVYWDTFLQAGFLEKDGEHLHFAVESDVITDNRGRVYFVEPPEEKNGALMVSRSFIDVVEETFWRSKDTLFKVGAIVIDAGHGGKDPGTMSAYTVGNKRIPVVEKEIALSVAKLLEERLKANYPEKKIVMTRKKDVYLSLSERTEIANSVRVKKGEAVICISIHANAVDDNEDRSAYGYECWYLPPTYRRTVINKEQVGGDEAIFPIMNSIVEEEYLTESILLSKDLIEAMGEKLSSLSRSRGLRENALFVIRNSNMPSVLFELGFVTNREEGLRLVDKDYQKKLAEGLFNGIKKFVTRYERSRGFCE